MACVGQPARTCVDERVGGVGELVARGVGAQLDVVGGAGPQRAVAVGAAAGLAALRADGELLHRAVVEREVRLRHLRARRARSIKAVTLRRILPPAFIQ